MLCRVSGEVQRGDILGQGTSRRGKGVDADRRVVGVDALITFPLCPLTTLYAVAYEKAAERGGGGGVWRSSG